ncbi:MAG: DUF4350 domain-containing protein [Pseudoxanthomonas sp.]
MKLPGVPSRIILWVLLALALCAAGVAWFLHTYERTEQEVPLPPLGEASYNPLYALKRALQADGVTVDSRQRINLATQALGANDTLLILGDPRSMGPLETRRVLAWVESGGHLIVRTPPTANWEKDGDVPMLEALGVLLTDDAPACEPLQVESQEAHVEFCSGHRFFFKGVVPELAWGDLQAAYVYARLVQGKGRVDVLADFDFLTNNGSTEGNLLSGVDRTGGLRELPHRALARQVLAPNYGKGTVHLVYAAQMPSLMRMLLSKGWPVWVPLALALLAWLWMRMQRFGPLQPSPPSARRSLLEHVRASGEHLFRYQRRALLYAAVRNAFLARLRRRDPVAAALSGEAQASVIAERLGLSVAEVQTALKPPSSHDKTAFRDRISTLIQLRKRI